MFSPTAVKFHYIFNLRDLSNVFQGLLFSTNECTPTPQDFLRLWIHEVARVYKDKLAEAKDIETYDKALKDILKKTFDDLFSENTMKTPLIFCHFAKGIGEPKYMPIETWEMLQKLLIDALKVASELCAAKCRLYVQGYNELNSVMDLVLFEDAMSHVCRINRILEVIMLHMILINHLTPLLLPPPSVPVATPC